MFHSSRTTLKELKKRYLNVLKKCLLLNMGIILLSTPLFAAETIDVTEADDIDALLLAGNRINILDDLEIDLISSGNPYTSQVHDQQGGSIYNKGFLNVYGDVVFQNNLTEPYVSVLSNRKEAIFHGKVSFLNNESGTNDSMGVVVYNVAKLTFKDEVLFQGNTAKSYGAFVNGWDPSVVAIFEKDAYFIENVVRSKAGAYSNDGGIVYFKGNVLFEKNVSTSYQGGAMFNTGETNFEKGKIVKFIKNKALQGGAIYNYTGGTINFNGQTFFEGNEADYGGAIMASFANGSINFNGLTVFRNNLGNHSGAISAASNGEINFNAPVMFIHNTARDKSGAVTRYANGKMIFNSDFTFAANSSQIANDILTESEIDFCLPVGSVGSFEGGIMNIGTITKSGLGTLILGDESVNAYIYQVPTKTGSFVQTAGLTISGSQNMNLSPIHLINGGELKTHGSEIAYKAVVGQNVDESGAVLSAGKVMHYTTKPKMEVNATTLANITFAGEDMGATIGVGTYNKAEQEKEIALVGDRLIEYLDDKGTLDSADDEMVRYQATDKLFTINPLRAGEKTKFKVTGALPNEKGNKIAFANGIVEIDESIGKTGAIYELDNSILETTKIENKVLSKNMILGDAQEYSFTELEVVDGTTLDVKNKKVSADTLTMNDNAILNIDLNSVTDHGKMTIGEVQNAEKGKLSLKLTKGLGQENGVYQVFDRDNDLTLQENKLFKIKDLENGAYEVSKKTSENLMKDFDMSASESAVAVAFIESESSHKAFNQMQEEMLEALQSEDKGKVQKAKKALKAVGKSEQPSSQSIAASHFNELTRVISQMAMEKEAEIVGHSGGDTDPRAKVYIKGLYERTKSSQGEGFRARSKGAVLGVQSEVTDTLTLGVGYAISQTTAKEDLRRTEVDTNTGFISAHYQPNAWWVSGLATFSRGEYEEEKQILSSTGKASYDVDSWGAQVMTGYDIKLENAIITPEVGLRYLSVKQEGYTDTLGTMVSGTQSDYLTALVGVKGTWDMGAIRPTAGVTVGYDIISDDVSALNTLANGASYTVNGEALDRLSTTVTTGIEADLGDRTTLKLEYSGTFRKEYADHSGMLKLEMRF